MERIETTILRNLIFDEEYSRKVIPFIQSDYFENKTERIIFEEAVQFIVKYDSAITVEALNIEIENRTDLTETEIKEARETTKTFDDAPVDNQWLLDSTNHSNSTGKSLKLFVISLVSFISSSVKSVRLSISIFSASIVIAASYFTINWAISSNITLSVRFSK